MPQVTFMRLAIYSTNTYQVLVEYIANLKCHYRSGTQCGSINVTS